MSRGRSGTKSRIQRNIKRQTLNTALKGFTRARAEKALTKDNCGEKRFVSHANYHVRRKAWVLAGGPMPDGKEDQDKLLKSLHLPVPEQVEEAAAQ